jgi:hypothetical protein
MLSIISKNFFLFSFYANPFREKRAAKVIPFSLLTTLFVAFFIPNSLAKSSQLESGLQIYNCFES